MDIKSYIEIDNNEYCVSTVHCTYYYETAIFGSVEGEMVRSSCYHSETYRTEDEARSGHDRIVENIVKYLK